MKGNTKEANTVLVHVTLDKAQHKRIAENAKREHRSIRGQIAKLIEDGERANGETK